MEIELKYKVEGNVKWDRLKHSSELAGMMEQPPWEKRMLAVYYDTPEGHLRRIGAAYRVRLEGNQYVATIKSRGEEEKGAMSHRLEWNVMQENELPNPDSFLQGEVQSGDSTEHLIPILDLLKQFGVREMGRTDFIRYGAALQWKGMRAEMCLDQGHLCANNRRSSIRELELELLEGTEQQINHLGQYLAQKYGLCPEPRSKYARVLMLLDGEEVE
ncbi:CYTH domain protein [Eubacteriaceae bacterium CHKCI005]|nr:CYTH domain protein [Eubacteriaceae bacterium CHKCI005]